MTTQFEVKKENSNEEVKEDDERPTKKPRQNYAEEADLEFGSLVKKGSYRNVNFILLQWSLSDSFLAPSISTPMIEDL